VGYGFGTTRNCQPCINDLFVAAGQSLTLHLAKCGYTTFPIVPLPNPESPPTSPALSTLLLQWSALQKRLRAKHPDHSGSVVPVMVDPEMSFDPRVQDRDRFRHAGETVRAYCKENNLFLVSIVCASRRTKSSCPGKPACPPVERLEISAACSSRHDPDGEGVSQESPPIASDAIEFFNKPPKPHVLFVPRGLRPTSLTMSDERTLVDLYRANILDPLAIIRELSDLLTDAQVAGRGRGRVVFVNGENLGGIGIGATDTDTTYREEVTPAARLVSAMRSETARMLREELNVMNVDVCEVVTGESRIRAPAMTGPTTKEASNPVRAHGTEDQPLQVPPAPEQ
jgi:hypothetical protein